MVSWALPEDSFVITMVTDGADNALRSNAEFVTRQDRMWCAAHRLNLIANKVMKRDEFAVPLALVRKYVGLREQVD
jgi:hypothetical protein